MPQISKFSRFQAATAEKFGDSGDKTTKLNNGAALRPIWQRGQNGDKAGTNRGQFYMMKMNSINLFIFPDPVHPPNPPGFDPCWLSLHFSGTGRKGISPWHNTTRPRFLSENPVL